MLFADRNIRENGIRHGNGRLRPLYEVFVILCELDNLRKYQICSNSIAITIAMFFYFTRMERANTITFQIGGLAVVGLATWALLDKVPWIGELVGNDLLTGAIYVLLAGGIVVVIISFFGCIGASREVKCMLLTVNSVTLSFFTPTQRSSTFGCLNHTTYDKKFFFSVLHHRVSSVRDHVNWRGARVRVP